MPGATEVIRLVGPERAVELFGIRLVGVNAETGTKLLVTVTFIALLILVSRGADQLARAMIRRRADDRLAFWVRQGIAVATAFALLVGLASIWFDDPMRLATALGLVTAGLAFALQRVVTAIAGYLVILRGRTFNVGDRIVMGGVRGDVVALGFIQTTIMEMGQPPPVSRDDPAMWVQARQYTGRIVTVSNAKIFDEPIYNYSREFAYIWEEMLVPVPYDADHRRAEQILLATAERQTVRTADLSSEALGELARRYGLPPSETGPRVYWRLTDNWLEMSVRFVVRAHGIRDVKDAMAREVLAGFDAAGIPVASATMQIVGTTLRLQDGGALAAAHGEAGRR